MLSSSEVCAICECVHEYAYTITTVICKVRARPYEGVTFLKKKLFKIKCDFLGIVFRSIYIQRNSTYTIYKGVILKNKTLLPELPNYHASHVHGKKLGLRR